MFQTETMGVSLFMKEREPGRPYYLSGAEFQRRPDGTVAKRELAGVTHDIVWADDPLGQTIASAELQLEFEEGPPRLLQLQALPARYYLKGGLYGGWDGWNHGDDRGEYAEGFDAWDLDDPLTRERARTLGRPRAARDHRWRNRHRHQRVRRRRGLSALPRSAEVPGAVTPLPQPSKTCN